MFAFLNGTILPEAEALVPVSDRGFLLGDGLFETVRVANGRPLLFSRHLDRLARGADFLKIKLPFAPAEMQVFARHLCEKNQLPKAVLRLTLTRGSGKRGYSIAGADSPTLAMTLHPLPPAWPDCTLVTSSLRVPAGDVLAAFKTTNKILNVLARAEAEEKGAHEALLLNTRGEVTETAGGNIFWISGDKVCTPPLESGALPGVTRAVVLEVCASLGLLVKHVVMPEQLRAADAIFTTQSVLGIVPVAVFDQQPVESSPLVARIAAAYEAFVRQELA